MDVVVDVVVVGVVVVVVVVGVDVWVCGCVYGVCLLLSGTEKCSRVYVQNVPVCFRNASHWTRAFTHGSALKVFVPSLSISPSLLVSLSLLSCVSLLSHVSLFLPLSHV